jgi:hypothetical protein
MPPAKRRHDSGDHREPPHPGVPPFSSSPPTPTNGKRGAAASASAIRPISPPACYWGEIGLNFHKRSEATSDRRRIGDCHEQRGVFGALGVAIARRRLRHEGWRGRRSRSRSDGSEAYPGTARPRSGMPEEAVRMGKKRPGWPQERRNGSRTGKSTAGSKKACTGRLRGRAGLCLDRR